MGILRNKEQRYHPIRIEDCEDQDVNNYANYLFDSDFSDSDSEEVAAENPAPKCIQFQVRLKKLRRFRRHYGPVEVVDGLQVRRNMGAQKWRRVENAKLIMAYTDMQDICLDGSDILEETISAFSRLLQDETKMKIWNDFIEMNEVDQAKMLKKIEKDNKSVNTCKNISPVKMPYKDAKWEKRHKQS